MRSNKPIAQLAIYAPALTWLVPGHKLFDIKCAWFIPAKVTEIVTIVVTSCARSVAPHWNSRAGCRSSGLRTSDLAPQLGYFAHAIELFGKCVHCNGL
jgi:hypothetical protein